jgi:hypothetical protein
MNWHNIFWYTYASFTNAQILLLKARRCWRDDTKSINENRLYCLLRT